MSLSSTFRRLTAALVCALCALTAAAQSRYSLRGIVTDNTGSAISAATVELHSNTDSPITQTLTNATGEFVLADLPAGSYTVFIPATNGFAARTLSVRVTSGMPPLKIQLALETVTQTVNVGEEPTLTTDAAANQDAVSVSGNDLQRLPVFDQDYIGALTPFLDPGSSSAGGITILVDGVEMKGPTVSPSAIAEVRTNSDPYSAEFGRPGRGRIDIITKPGMGALISFT